MCRDCSISQKLRRASLLCEIKLGNKARILKQIFFPDGKRFKMIRINDFPLEILCFDLIITRGFVCVNIKNSQIYFPDIGVYKTAALKDQSRC